MATSTKTTNNYTKPALRERLKEQIQAGSRGGRAGQWSARKAQLLAHEYEAKGGGFKGPKSSGQKHLDQWTKEQWTTADRKPAVRGKATARYLPKGAWDKLSPDEKKATDAKKRAGSRKGKQFVANTRRAKSARKSAAQRRASVPRAVLGEEGEAPPAPRFAA